MPPIEDGAGAQGDDQQGAGTGAGEQNRNPADGNGNGADDGGSKVSGGNDPFAELDQATREWVTKRHGGDVAKLAKQAFELDKFAGKAIQMPGEDADPSEWDKFFQKIGRPEAADKYGFEVPENLPETLPYDAERDNKFASKCFELGLSKKQAAGLREWFIQDTVANVGSMEESIKAEVGKLVETSKAELTKVFGPMEGERFRASMELADRFFKAVDKSGKLQEKLQKIGMLGPNREVLDADLAMAFAAGGTALYAEDTKVNGDPAHATENPFEDGAGFNLTRALHIAKNDPDRAQMLILAAGKQPSAFGLK